MDKAKLLKVAELLGEAHMLLEELSTQNAAAEDALSVASYHVHQATTWVSDNLAEVLLAKQ